MRPILFLLMLSVIAQADTPIRLGDLINLIPPATNADGRTVLFAAGVAPDGTAQKGTNLYLFTQGPAANSIRQLTKYAGSIPFIGVTGVALAGATGIAGYTALPTGMGGLEEVHVIDTSSAVDRTVATDKQGCIQPLCVNCFRSCVGPLHLNAEASKVLYAVARTNPFYLVNADGTEFKHLPVYVGALAPASQRVISSAGQVVFTSSAPFGPTFAAAPNEVYVMNLDGTGIKQVTKSGINPSFFAANATISADGSLIAFESNFSDSGPEQANQIWVARPDGAGRRKISTGTDAATNPSISADGYVVTFLQGGQIKRVRTNTNGPVLALTKLSISTPRDPVVSADGTQVVFALGPQSGTSAAVYRIPTDSTSDIREFFVIYAPHFLNADGVKSAAGYGSASPGSLISVYGVNLGADELTQAGGFPLPASLGDVSLDVNGQPVPLLATTPWQINAQLPQTLPAGTATFQVRFAGGVTLAPLSVEVKSSSPENFAFPFTRGNLYYSQAAAFHAGTAIAADMDHPAAAGEKLEIYGLGLGMTDPVVDAGIASPLPPARALQTPRVQIGGLDAAVTFAGLTPGLAGVYQVNAIVPAGVAPGIQSLGWLGPDGPAVYSSIAVK